MEFVSVLQTYTVGDNGEREPGEIFVFSDEQKLWDAVRKHYPHARTRYTEGNRVGIELESPFFNKYDPTYMVLRVDDPELDLTNKL